MYNSAIGKMAIELAKTVFETIPPSERGVTEFAHKYEESFLHDDPSDEQSILQDDPSNEPFSVFGNFSIYYSYYG